MVNYWRDGRCCPPMSWCHPCSHGGWCPWLHVSHPGVAGMELPAVLGSCWHPRTPGRVWLGWSQTSPQHGVRCRAGRGSHGLPGPHHSSCCAGRATAVWQPVPGAAVASVPSGSAGSCPRLKGRQPEEQGQQEGLA